jgi:hypothetical protein
MLDCVLEIVMVQFLEHGLDTEREKEHVLIMKKDG